MLLLSPGIHEAVGYGQLIHLLLTLIVLLPACSHLVKFPLQCSGKHTYFLLLKAHAQDVFGLNNAKFVVRTPYVIL